MGNKINNNKQIRKNSLEKDFQNNTDEEHKRKNNKNRNL